MTQASHSSLSWGTDELAAPPGRRLTACLIDALVVLTLMTLADMMLLLPNYLLELWATSNPQVIWPVYIGNTLDLLVKTVPTWLYFAFMEASPQQATFGKIICGLRVSDANGNALSFRHASRRHFAKLSGVLTLTVGYWLMLWHPQKRMLHDQLSGSYVSTQTVLSAEHSL